MKVWQLIAELQKFSAGRDVAIGSGNDSGFDGVYDLIAVDGGDDADDMVANIYVVAGKRQDD